MSVSVSSKVANTGGSCICCRTEGSMWSIEIKSPCDRRNVETHCCQTVMLISSNVCWFILTWLGVLTLSCLVELIYFCRFCFMREWILRVVIKATPRPKQFLSWCQSLFGIAHTWPYAQWPSSKSMNHLKLIVGKYMLFRVNFFKANKIITLASWY